MRTERRREVKGHLCFIETGFGLIVRVEHTTALKKIKDLNQNCFSSHATNTPAQLKEFEPNTIHVSSKYSIFFLSLKENVNLNVSIYYSRSIKQQSFLQVY